jgi:hypothetical protein
MPHTFWICLWGRASALRAELPLSAAQDQRDGKIVQKGLSFVSTRRGEEPAASTAGVTVFVRRGKCMRHWAEGLLDKAKWTKARGPGVWFKQ